MTSVGIMSMQRILNYGSSLQAYALRRLLEGAQPGARVDFVDYRPGPTLVRSVTHGGASTRATRALGKLREYSKVDAPLSDKARFFNHKRSYAAKYFPLVGISPDENLKLDLDLQVIGSDEVFNCVQSNAKVGYTRDLFGHGSHARSVISYAASFGNTTLEKIDAVGIRSALTADFSRFEAISVRDGNSVRVVQEMTGRTPELHLDPTLIFDFASESRVPAQRRQGSPYIIVYGYSGRLNESENDAVRRYADETGARVLALGGLQSSADEFIDCDPFTLLAYFRDAAAVVTDTFHGTIFSIINHVPFATIIRRSAGAGYGNEEKLGFLLEHLGLESRALHRADQLSDVLSQPIDFAAIDSFRLQEQSRTARYLHEAFLRLSDD